MEAKAVAKFQRVSPRKTRLVARNVVGLPVESALNLLEFTPNKPARILHGLVRSAFGNVADQAKKDGISFQDGDIRVKEIVVNEGPSWKRFMPRAQGRATKIRKRTSHITVVLVERNEFKQGQD